jgi:hypothetical protein
MRPQGRTARATIRGESAGGEPPGGGRGRPPDGRIIRKGLGGAPRRVSSSALTRVTADVAALNAFTAAAEAFVSVGYRNDHFVDSALKDYNTLVHLNLGRHPEPGAPVDPSPGGPLGPL